MFKFLIIEKPIGLCNFSPLLNTVVFYYNIYIVKATMYKSTLGVKISNFMENVCPTEKNTHEKRTYLISH